MANATSGAAKITVADGQVASGASPSAATLTTEAVQTLTWTAVDVYLQNKLTLTGFTPTAADMCVMALTFTSSGWTLSQVSTWIFALIWE
jgi:hypothetical protein